MKKILFMAAGIAALTFTSCKKDDSVENNPGNGNTTKLLKKITKTENGETTVYNFTYDANKRLTSYKSNDNVEQVVFTYDGAGNIIRVEETEEGFKNIYAYTYNNGIPVSATFKSWERTAGEPDDLIEDDILTYTVENGVVSNIHLYMGIYDEETDFELSYTNGNLTGVESTGTYPYSATFTYGNKKTAFPKLSNYVLDQAGFSLQFFAKNEVLSATFDFPGTELDNTITTQYSYDAAGFPLSSNDGETLLQFEYQ
jgi:YD repeat-containing protein